MAKEITQTIQLPVRFDQAEQTILPLCVFSFFLAFAPLRETLPSNKHSPEKSHAKAQRRKKIHANNSLSVRFEQAEQTILPLCVFSFFAPLRETLPIHKHSPEKSHAKAQAQKKITQTIQLSLRFEQAEVHSPPLRLLLFRAFA